MNRTDRKVFIEVVIGFAELKGKQLSAPALELYWRSLQHWPLAEFQAAAEQLLRSCEFMPLPKDFEDLRKAGRLTAGEAWTQVLEYARKGYTCWQGGGISRDASVPSPEDHLINRAVNAIGGYQAIAMSDVDKTHFLERRFCEHFEAMQEASDVREAVPEIAYSGRRSIAGPQSAGKLLGKSGENS